MTTEAARLLGHDYWLVRSTPRDGVDAEQVAAVADEHVAWLLGLERDGHVLASGPLLSGPGVRPGAGVTIFRAPDEEAARRLADQDPFVRRELRTFTVYRWRLNEGNVRVRLSLGAGTYEWE